MRNASIDFSLETGEMPRGTVLAVCRGASHHFSKIVQLSVRLTAGHGVEGDAHAGVFVQHRHLARQNPHMPNNRQVHLLQSEVFDDLKALGYDLGPGQLGENIATRGIDLLGLPLRSRLRLGRFAVIELTGLRTPCGYIDKFRKRLKRQMIVQADFGPSFRCGVMAIVVNSGDLMAGDSIAFEGAPFPPRPLPAI